MLREPLLHFALIGAGLFGASLTLRRPSDDIDGRNRRITVSARQIEQMTLGFARTWRRPPSVEELDGLISEHVRDEVLSREAVSMGLDRDDLIIKRRLRQKMDVVLDDVVQLAEPSERDLSDFFDQHPALFSRETKIAFRQVFLNRERTGPAEAAAILARLRGGEMPENLGDPTLLPARLPPTAGSELDNVFGPGFSMRLLARATGSWEGPLESSYGAHFVLVTDKIPGGPPSFNEVRDEVRREWAVVRRRESAEAAYRNLLGRYQVVVEGPGKPAP